jgi:hypothetical protein
MRARWLPMSAGSLQTVSLRRARRRRFAAVLGNTCAFPVPSIPARRHLAGAGRRGERVKSGLALLIRSGLWAQLSPAAKAIAPVLLEMAEKDSAASERMTVQLSYVGITRTSGIKSPNAIRSALVELGEAGLMLPPGGRAPGKLVQETARYTMTPYSEELLEMAQATAQQAKDEIAAGVELRARQRRERVRVFAGKQQGKEQQ